MTRKDGVLLGLALLALSISNPFAFAAVSENEASLLKSTLTPFGAERAGNATGTIPAWEGGYTHVPPGYRSGQLRPDPFADEKPLFQVTAQNMDAYSDKLSDGVKALLTRFPTFRLDVYPTHRTAAAPQWVYDNTFRNATRAKTTHAGLSVEGAYGGIPFPIPKTGAEAMWNHLLGWKGESISYDLSVYVQAGSTPVLATAGKVETQYPYYYKEGDLKNFNGITYMVKLITTGPPFKVGENFLAHDPINAAEEGRRAWQYLPGQRRVRRAPTIGYDVPNFYESGFTFYDEAYLFNGSLDRYDWKLLGKQEMLIPYNVHRFYGTKPAEMLGPRHLNPSYLRWEQHRVWVVEATLAAGKRHVIPRRRFYLDEDTWLAILADGWDAKNQLWHTAHALPMLLPELPAVTVNSWTIYDFSKRGYMVNGLIDNEQRHYQAVPRRPEDVFSPATLAGEGIR